jgi:hypothetical protein
MVPSVWPKLFMILASMEGVEVEYSQVGFFEKSVDHLSLERVVQ